MRQKVKKSVSILPEGEEKIISFISDFSWGCFFFHIYNIKLYILYIVVFTLKSWLTSEKIIHFGFEVYLFG